MTTATDSETPSLARGLSTQPSGRSVASQLRLVFLVVSLLALAAAAIAFFSFQSFEKALLNIVGRTIPVMVTTQELSSSFRQLIVTSNSLSQATNLENLSERQSFLADGASKIKRLVSEIEAETAVKIGDVSPEALLGEILSVAEKKADLIERKISLTGTLDDALNEHRSAASKLEGYFDSVLSQASADLSAAASALEARRAVSSSLREETEISTDSLILLETGPAIIEGLLEALFRSQNIGEKLDRLLLLSSVSEIEFLKSAYLADFRRITLLASSLETNAINLDIAESLYVLSDVVTRQDNIFGLFAQLVELRQNITALETSTSSLVDSIEIYSNDLVRFSRSSATRSSAEMEQQLGVWRVLLAAIMVVTFAISALYASRFISARIVRPLDQLSKNAQSLANGDADITINAVGDSEFRTLAQSLQQYQSAIKELKSRGAELQRSNEELEQFAYIASHDLQEPLRMVSSYCELLDRRYADKLGEDGLEFLKFAVEGAQRMRALLNDLLQYSRVGREYPVFAKIDLNDLFKSVLLDLKPMIEERHAEITVGQLGVVQGDNGLLHRLMLNLVQNAIKFSTEQTPTVSISSKLTGDMMTVSIADNGIGIDPKFSERIFDVFQRLNTRKVYQGNGIGLAIAKRIAELHQGRVWCEPNIRGGTVFNINLKSVRPDDERIS